MGFFPYESFYIETDLTPDEIEKKLMEMIGVKINLSFTNWSNKSSGPYNGWANGLKFNISKNIVGRNSFLPQIEGSINKTKRTSVHIVMKLHPAVIVFLSFCVLFLGIGGSYDIMLKHQFTTLNLIPFGMIVSIYLMATIGFKSESKDSKWFLINTFDGELAGK